MNTTPYDRRRRAISRRCWTAAAIGTLLFSVTVCVHAADYTVTDTSDSITDSGSLRYAINQSENFSTDVTDTITINATGRIALASGVLNIYNANNISGKTLIINGPGSANLAIDGTNNGVSGLMQITNNHGNSATMSVEISGVTFQNGIDEGNNGGIDAQTGNARGGGGIYNDQTLSLGDVVVTNCTEYGDGIQSSGFADGSGGGINNEGTLTMTNCTVSNNRNAESPTNSSSNTEYGGGICSNFNPLSMTNCIVTGNNDTAGGTGGGIYCSGPLSLTDCSITKNNAVSAYYGTGYGGGLYCTGSSTNANLTYCQISDNSASGSTFAHGGGIYSYAITTIDQCTINGNTITDPGTTSPAVTNYGGGGIYVSGTSFDMTNSTIVGNSCAGEGGGIVDYKSATSLLNCTVTGNSAVGDNASEGGGGIWFNPGGATVDFDIESSVVASNNVGSSGVQGLDLYVNNGGTGTLSFTSGGSNLIGVGDNTGDASGFVNGDNDDQVGATVSPLDAMLGPLGDYGGLTQTVPLLPGSPAIDADYNGAVNVDERSVIRPQGVRNDIGAFEVNILASNDIYTIAGNEPLTVSASTGVLANDSDETSGKTLAATEVTQPASGILTLNADGSFTYTPNTSFVGADSFTYLDSDGTAGLSNIATVTINVTAPAPTVVNTFPAGLQMLSVPYDYSDTSLSSILSQSNPVLAVWDPTQQPADYVLTPTPPADTFHPGQGYWARFTTTVNLYSGGAAVSTSQPFAITLSEGWNMIGDPFPSSVSLSNVTLQADSGSAESLTAAGHAGLIVLPLYTYTAGATQYQSVDQTGSLAPYAGYWIYASQNCTLEVPPPAAT